MRLPIEEWLAQQELDSASTHLLEESIECYRARAYRGAMMLSWLGFLSVLRSRIQRASPPSLLTNTEWETLQDRARRQSSWDGVVFDATQRKDGAVFLLDDDLRQQVAFFRARRNDAAHGKADASAAVVEVFWAFMRSSFGRFAVRGSAESLLARVIAHYDPSITAPGTPPDLLIADIPSSVPENELPVFWKDVREGLEASSSPEYFFRPSPFAAFMARAIRSADYATATSAIEQVAQDPNLLLRVLRTQTDTLLPLCNGRPQLVRKLWHDYLLDGPGTHIDLEIYAGLLRNDLIPDSELAEANRRVVVLLRGQRPSGSDGMILRRCGFYDEFRELAFGKRLRFIDVFDWANANAELVIEYLAYNPMDGDVARAIHATFNKPDYADELHTRLQSFVSNAPAFRSKLLEEWTSQGLDPPEYLSLEPAE